MFTGMTSTQQIKMSRLLDQTGHGNNMLALAVIKPKVGLAWYSLAWIIWPCLTSLVADMGWCALAGKSPSKLTELILLTECAKNSSLL